ncbi:MAG: hypothetical protein AAB610_01405 [Patescibacteria group bacterium]
MNPDKLKEEIAAILPQNSMGVSKQPLHALDNQVEPGDRQHAQKPIRTYESDVAEALARKKSSVMSMVVAENKRETGSESISNKPPSQAGKKILLIVISLVFIVAGVAGAYYLYLKSPLVPDKPAQKAIKIPSIVEPDTQKIVAINSSNEEQLVTLLSTEFMRYEIGSEKILELIPTKTVASTTVRVTGSQFVSAIKFDMPDILKRSLTDQWMLGVYDSAGQNYPFMIFKTDFFQNAFAGMLKWEEFMPEDLADLLGYRQRTLIGDPLSTTSIATFFNIRGTFEDKIIKNRDVREFISQEGEMLFLYSFIDENTVVVATSESTISALLDRIEKQTYIR